VSVTTIQFTTSEEGTGLNWTEQGTYLDGIDGIEAPRLREEGNTPSSDYEARNPLRLSIISVDIRPGRGLPWKCVGFIAASGW
jgi:hypothetical protein